MPVLLIGAVGAIGVLAAVVVFMRRRKSVLLDDAKSKYRVQLVDRKEINHDTRRFRFALESPEQTLGLPTGQHIYVNAVINGKATVRKYTPTSPHSQKGSFDLVIKVYFANTHPKFPQGGLMTQHMEQLHIGDSIEIQGPSGKLVYTSPCEFRIRKGTTFTTLRKRRIGMIAGGSGVTPMYQIAQRVLNNPDDIAELWLVFANQTEEDILIREELEALQSRFPRRFKIWYTLDRAPKDGTWKFSEGFVDEEMLRQHLPAPADDVIILSCGPPPMIKFAILPNLEKVGYSPSMHFEY